MQAMNFARGVCVRTYTQLGVQVYMHSRPEEDITMLCTKHKQMFAYFMYEKLLFTPNILILHYISNITDAVVKDIFFGHKLETRCHAYVGAIELAQTAAIQVPTLSTFQIHIIIGQTLTKKVKKIGGNPSSLHFEKWSGFLSQFASNIFSAACIYTLIWIYDTDVFTTWFFYLIAGIIPNNFLTSESLGQLSASDVCILIHGQYFAKELFEARTCPIVLYKLKNIILYFGD
ncbi:hypothetical protein ACJX0J_026341 [Zea mays]